MKTTVWMGIVLLAMLSLTLSANAAIKASGNDAPIAKGQNVLGAAAFNDSPGSSDMSLIVQLKIDGKIVVDEGSDCRAIVPDKNIPSDKDPTGWTQPKFDDSKWQKGTYGVGYGDVDDKTVLGNGTTAAIYTRSIFDVKDIKSSSKVELGVDFDDGCVIWINGVEVARESNTSIPDKPEWDSWTDKGSGHSHEASGAKPPRYEIVELPLKIVGNPFAVEPVGKLATSWGKIKAHY